MISKHVIAMACAAGLAVSGPALAHPRHHRAHRHVHAQTGVASYYGTHMAGRKTASGKRFSPAKLTAASKTLPLGTKAKVINRETGKSVKVTITDRGPFKGGRILDVSPKAAQTLGMKDDGVAKVKVKPLGGKGAKK